MNEDIKKLEQEAKEIQAHLDNLNDKIAEMKSTPKLEKGKYYQSCVTDTVIYMTGEGNTQNTFTGIVVTDNDTSIVGTRLNIWAKEVFHEVTPEWRKVWKSKTKSERLTALALSAVYAIQRLTEL